MRKFLAITIAALTLAGAIPIAGHALASRRTVPATEPSRARVAGDLAATLAAASPDAPLTVFVHGRTRAAAVAAVEAAGMEQIGEFESIGVPVAVGTARQVRDLSGRPGLTYVEPNRQVQLFLETSRTAIRADEAIERTFRAPCPKGRDGQMTDMRLRPYLRACTTTVGPFDGAGQTIAVVDGGVDGTHPMFDADGESKVVRNLKVACINNLPGVTFGEDTDPNTCPDGKAADPFFVDMTDATNDSDTPSIGGHGTHVAGIAGGYAVTTGGGHELSGVAPGAKLLSISIGQGIGIYAANAALDWIVRHHDDPCELAEPDAVACPPITVVNNSYGSTGEWDAESVTTKLQDLIVDAGIVMVWANGNGDLLNDGGDGSDNRSGSDAQHPRPGVISVANYDDGNSGTRDGALDSSSSRGHGKRPTTWPDVSAPGSDITSACRPYLAICTSGESDPDYGTIGGTSMAAPHVAGAVAVLRQAKPSLTPGQIEELLEDTAYKFSFGAPYWTQADPANPDSGTSFDKGHGLIDLAAALAEAFDTEAPAVESAACTSPVVADEAGDATGFYVLAATPLPSEPQLDVLTGDLAWDATAQALVLTATATGLEERNPPGTTGIVYEFEFGHAGEKYFVRASRESTGEEHGTFGQLATPSPLTFASELATTFDIASDTVTVVLPNAAFAGTEVVPFGDGQQLTGLKVLTRRQMGGPKNDVTPALGAPRSVLFTADSTPFGCAFIIGMPTATEPQPFPTEEAPAGDVDGSIADGESFSATGVTPTDRSGTPLVDGASCGGPDEPGCITYRVEVRPAGSSTLFVSLDPSLSSVVLDDFDLYVYDAAGTVVASSGGTQTVVELIGATVDVTETAVYTIVVDPYNVPKDVEFTVTASLEAA